MAGYWPSSIFCVFMERDRFKVLKLATKTMRIMSSLLDLTSSVNKGSVLWLSGKFFLRDIEGSAERER